VSLLAQLDAMRRRHVTLEREGSGRLVGVGDPSAISVNGPPGAPALLAFHGFAGTPNEVRPITDVAARRGWWARAPRLAGHGPSAQTLLDVGWNEWAQEAVLTLRELRTLSGARVVVCGISLGSLLAAHLAAMFPEDIAGLIAVSNATTLRYWPIGLSLRLFEKFHPFENRLYVAKSGADIRDLAARACHMTYDVNPIAGAVEVLRAGRVVQGELGNVRCPTLVLHGYHDRVCPVSNAERFAHTLGTTDVDVAILPRSGHILTVDFDRDEVARRVTAFLQRVSEV